MSEKLIQCEECGTEHPVDECGSAPPDNQPAAETRRLYREGDSVDIELLIYPGPREFKTVGEVVECLSPTYYRVAYVDYRGLLRTKRFLRSQLS